MQAGIRICFEEGRPGLDHLIGRFGKVLPEWTEVRVLAIGTIERQEVTDCLLYTSDAADE